MLYEGEIRRQGATSLRRHLFYRSKACGGRNPVATAETLIYQGFDGF
jgi:hypothetical protein